MNIIYKTWIIYGRSDQNRKYACLKIDVTLQMKSVKEMKVHEGLNIN